MAYRRIMALGLCTLALATGCNNAERTQELIQARLDAEKVKDLQTQNQELRTSLDELRKENETLKLSMAKAEGSKKLAAVTPTAKTVTKPKAAANTGADAVPESPAEKAQVKEEVTGGSSFK